MVARKRKHNESFEEYRSNLKFEQKVEDYRLSMAYRLRKPTSVLSRVLNAVVPKQGQFMTSVFVAVKRAALRKTTKAQRVARRFNRASR
tara:strand:+ start:353 stop:619 length:267 start_codon:yes stop_codon:yes gene_type:complete